MPNWCWNTVEFRGEPEDCAAFRQLMGAARGAFDFEAVLPTPPELMLCNDSDATAYTLKYGDWESMPWWGAENWPSRDAALQAARHPENATRWVYVEFGPGQNDRREIPRTFDQAADMAHTNVACHGHVYWNGWRSENWGTKWNVEDGARWQSAAGVEHVAFNTAWGPPLPVLERLAERFPGAEIELAYREPGMGFAGRAVFAIGACVEHEHDAEGCAE